MSRNPVSQISSAKAFFLFLLIFAFPNTSHAEIAAGCHCFKDMSYKPGNKFAADDYILASSFNSLISRSFDISKKSIVMLKMTRGANQGDLLVGLKTAKVTGEDLNFLLEKRKNGESWQKILSAPKRTTAIKHDEILTNIRAGIPTEQAGQQVADASISEFFKIPADTVASFRSAGLNEKEITLILILSAHTQKNSRELADLYQKGGKSWSEIAFDLGIIPRAAGRLILNY